MGYRKGDWKLGVLWVLVMLGMLFLFLRNARADEKTTLRASPKMSIEGQTVTLFLHLSAEDSCLGRRWYWPDGTTSYHESDCDPDDRQPDSESVRVQGVPGDWTVCVGLEQAGHTKKKVCDSFHVGG